MVIVGEKKMDSVWIRLYEETKKVLHPRKVSEWMEVGGVAAAIETTSGISIRGFVWMAPVPLASVQSEMRFSIC
mgnify:CR=1 FL=1